MSRLLPFLFLLACGTVTSPDPDFPDTGPAGGDAGDPGDGGAGLDADPGPDVFEPLCDPFLDIGCGPELGCYILSLGPSCTSIGTRPEGADCLPVNDCAPGLVCGAFFCRVVCDSQHKCDAGTCIDYMAGYGYCDVP